MRVNIDEDGRIIGQLTSDVGPQMGTIPQRSTGRASLSVIAIVFAARNGLHTVHGKCGAQRLKRHLFESEG